MTGERPPEEKDVEDRRGLLVFFVNAIDALSFNAHFLIEPFLATAHLAEKPLLLLEFSRSNHLGGFSLNIVSGGWLSLELLVRAP